MPGHMRRGIAENAHFWRGARPRQGAASTLGRSVSSQRVVRLSASGERRRNAAKAFRQTRRNAAKAFRQTRRNAAKAFRQTGRNAAKAFRQTGRNHMKSFIGGTGARAVLAAVLGAAGTAAVMMAVQPARAQEPRVVVRSLGSSASIGVGIRDVTSDDAAKAKQGQPSGVYIESVREGSPAARAGIQAGDIVVDFDGERVRSASHFTRLVQESVPNREVTAVVIRGTSKQNLKIAPDAGGAFNILSNNGRRQLQDLQLNLPRFDFNNDALRRALPASGATLGVTVSPLSDQLAGYFGVKQGVLVSAVTTGSPAAGAGVRAGDVITAINGQSVSNSSDVTRALRQGSGESVEISVTRDKKSLSLKATLPTRPRPRASGRSGLPV